MIRPINPEELRLRMRSVTPFPHLLIDNFLDPEFARLVHDSFPTYENARKIGRAFNTVNEKMKTQITDSSQFAAPVLELNRILAAPSWLELLSALFDIPSLLSDGELIGGGMHQTGPRGRLDVHVDFNYIAERQLHRRLNILIFFNPEWKPEWGGFLELWDQEVKRCHHSFEPLFNRCVIFETSEISYHGVTAVHCPPDQARKSFAAYYYTREAPAHWAGEAHDTVFRSRPYEVIRGRVLMPAERAARILRQSMWDLRRQIRQIVKGPPANR
ncbi:MAG: 2OG-Fe(II) oxygenase [Candidatus Sulfopaludibacter sp.]|nr:2OG-Fe(II) oxygenase [Candidatus Sulfopaludibacter sp.]